MVDNERVRGIDVRCAWNPEKFACPPQCPGNKTGKQAILNISRRRDITTDEVGEKLRSGDEAITDEFLLTEGVSMDVGPWTYRLCKN